MSQLIYFGSGSGPLPPQVPTTFTGDVGVAVPVSNNLNVITGQSTNNSGSSVQINASGDTLLFNVTDNNFNTIMGRDSGNATFSGIGNTVFGQNTLTAFVAGNVNTSFGYTALFFLQNGSANTAIGGNALGVLTTGVQNTAIGQGALANLPSGDGNIALGIAAGQALQTGGESGNIHMGNYGVDGESNTIRLGATTTAAQGGGLYTQNRNFQAGIAGVSISNALPVYIDSTTGQLGSNPGSWTAFTPTIEGETSAGVTTYGTRIARYIRQGNTITAQFSIAVASATGTGNVLIGGLPVAISASATQSPLGPLSVGGLTWPASRTQVTSFGIAGSTNMRILCSGSAIAATFMQIANIVFTVNGTVTYEV